MSWDRPLFQKLFSILQFLLDQSCQIVYKYIQKVLKLKTHKTKICVLQDLFRDIPLDHIWHDQTRAPKFCIWPYSGAYLCSPYINKWGIPETQKKMQFRRVGLVSVGVSQSKVTTNIILSQNLFCHFVLQNIVICNESCVGFFTLFR